MTGRASCRSGRGGAAALACGMGYKFAFMDRTKEPRKKEKSP